MLPPWASVLSERYQTIEVVRPLSGGNLSEAWLARLDGTLRVVKWQPDPRSAIFHVETQTLKAFASSGFVQVPDIEQISSQCIVLQWIDTGSSKALRQAAERLGRGLAQIHAMSVKAFELPWGQGIGVPVPPSKKYFRSGEFFVAERMHPLIRRLRQMGYMNPSWTVLEGDMSGLAEHVDQWSRPPALLHGDLWSGNWLGNAAGIPYLIDGQGYYGDPWADVAFSEMFGGMDPEFYRGYTSVSPLTNDYRKVRPIYQLYHALMHLLLFGHAYESLVNRLVADIVGEL